MNRCVGAHDISIDSVQFTLDETMSTIQVHESQLKNVEAERDSALAELKAYTLLVARKALETSQVVYQDLCSLVKDSDSRLRELRAKVLKLRGVSPSRWQILLIYLDLVVYKHFYYRMRSSRCRQSRR